MPVTAKLSQRFYQRLGDEIATELVEWFNAVDATYRSDVRAIADAQSARIDAQMGQLRAELRQELAEMEARLRTEIVGVRADLRQDLGGLRAEVGQEIGGLRAEVGQEIGGLRAEVWQELAEVRTEMRAGFAESNAKMEGLKSELLRWMFLFWIGSVGSVLLLRM